jgi:DNA invertase Pin-like site-specific DNA recombinase
MGRGFMAMMSALAEDERQRIIKRTHEGRQIARAKGVKMGRKPILRRTRPKRRGTASPRVRQRAPSPKATASASARLEGSHEFSKLSALV